MEQSSDIIGKYNLSEAVKRFQQINEYTFYNSTMAEAEPEDNQMNGGQGMPPMGGQDMGGGMPQNPQMGGQQMPQQPMDSMGQGGQDNGQIPPMDAQGAEGEQPMDNADGDGEVPPFGGEEPEVDDSEDDVEDIEMDTEQPGDEVVDVDELTQSQETTEFKVDDLDDKLSRVLKVIEKFNDAIESNDQKIEDLKQEFAKRNPTPEETLNLRSLASYPFSERPDEYWKKQQELHPNYNVISDNDVSTADEQKEFEIRRGDIDNFNERDVMKSLGESHIRLCDFLDF